jgi:octaprenyl-diphosphate synthase
LANLSDLSRARRATRQPASPRDDIRLLVRDRLGEVETLFRENLASPVGIVAEIGEFVAESGGKRIRPTLHLLSARLCGYQGSRDVLLAAVLEFIHCATLIHDDIIDFATTRRGAVSTNHRWGNDVAVLFGDYLFAKAMAMALQAESLPIMRKLADVTLRMTEGEMQQTRYAGRIDLTEHEYLGLVERKTAALFGCCCELAGMLAGVDPPRTAALRRYGRGLGMAFQLVDDLLDFTGDPEAMGKPAASDLREGKATLAVIDLLAAGPPEARPLVLHVMGGCDPGSAELARLTELLRESGAFARARRRAAGFAELAVAELAGFPDGPARRALGDLPRLLAGRLA